MWYRFVGQHLRRWYKWCMSRRDERERLDRILSVAIENNRILRHILSFLHGIATMPTSIRMSFEGATMPVTLSVGQSVVGTTTEADAAGVNVPIPNPASLSYTSSDDTIASSTTNSDGTVTVKAVAAGTVTITVTDASNSLTTSDTVTVTAPPDVATTIAINWGTPQ